MNEEQFDRLVSIVGDKGSAAYALALKQVHIDANAALVWIALGLAFVAIGTGLFIWTRRYDWNYSEDAIAGYLPAIGFWLVGSILAIVYTYNAVVLRLNPEWVALQKLGGLVQ